jgi:hypothetical protein
MAPHCRVITRRNAYTLQPARRVRSHALLVLHAKAAQRASSIRKKSLVQKARARRVRRMDALLPLAAESVVSAAQLEVRRGRGADTRAALRG